MGFLRLGCGGFFCGVGGDGFFLFLLRISFELKNGVFSIFFRHPRVASHPSN